MHYHKLIRDNIPEILDQKGVNYKTHVANDQEYWVKLKEKLLEEVKEFCESESIEELADIWEVIEVIIVYKQFDQKAIQAEKVKKVQERGSFSKRIILEES